MEVYRITQEAYASDLSGNGSRLYGGRWNNEGTFAVYTSQSRALALLENLVHVPLHILKEKTYIISTIFIPDGTGIEVVDISALPVNWNAFDVEPATRAIGTKFFESSQNLLLQVSSVLMPEEFNFVINPLLPAMKNVQIIKQRKLVFNDRLLQAF